jgi:CHASE2 domain-containing sensor protein
MEPPAASPCSTYYALSLQLAHHYLKAEGISLKFITEDRWQLGRIVFHKLEPHMGFYQQSSELQGFQILLNYRSKQSPQDVAQQVTLTDVLTNRVKPDFVKDKIILIGVSDPTVEDNFNTPYNGEIRGLLLHAQMVSQILSAVQEQRSLLWFWPLGADACWVSGWSLVGGLIAWHFLSSPLRLGLAEGAAIISLNGICFVLLLTNGVLLPLVPSLLALIVTSGSIIAYKAFKSQKFE